MLRLEAAWLGEHREYTMPMNQEQLADCTGLTPVHVNRMLRGIEKDGVISRTHWALSVSDCWRPAEEGDFTSAYLHLRGDQLGMVQ